MPTKYSTKKTKKYKKYYKTAKSDYSKLKKLMAPKVETVIPTGPILSSVISKQGKVMPNKFKCKLIYEEDITATASALVPTSYAFKANAIYDPNKTGTGHQPYGRDQIADFYNRYDVTSAKIYVQYYIPGNVTNNQLAWMRVFLLDIDNLGGLASSIYAFRESGLGSRCAPIGAYDATAMFEKSHCEQSFSLRKVATQKSSLDYGAVLGADPLKPYYFVIGFSPDNFATGYTVSHHCRVRIEYNVTFSEPLLLGES